jgi:hypothetical protein
MIASNRVSEVLDIGASPRASAAQANNPATSTTAAIAPRHTHFTGRAVLRRFVRDAIGLFRVWDGFAAKQKSLQPSL